MTRKMSNSEALAVRNLKRLIRASGYSVEKVALSTGIPKSTLSNYWHGRHPLRLSAMEKIADCLDVDITEFFKQR